MFLCKNIVFGLFMMMISCAISCSMDPHFVNKSSENLIHYSNAANHSFQPSCDSLWFLKIDLADEALSRKGLKTRRKSLDAKQENLEERSRLLIKNKAYVDQLIKDQEELILEEARWVRDVITAANLRDKEVARVREIKINELWEQELIRLRDQAAKWKFYGSE